MVGNLEKTPEGWRNFSTKVPVASMRIKRGDLKRLYKIINDKQIEVRDAFMPLLAIQPSETESDFEARRKRVFDAFVTSMTAQGTNGEVAHGNNEAFLEDSNLPEQLLSIFFSTKSVPNAFGITPPCHLVVFLDFTRPPKFDLTRMPTLPTVNETNFEIIADSETWFAATKARLSQFFDERRTGVNWLHRAGIYDLLLFFVGVPIAIWVSYRVSVRLPSMHSALVGAFIVYAFLFSVILFRFGFAYSRWVYPKIEMDSETVRATPLRHRAAWSAIVIGIVAGLLWDAMKYLAAS